MIQPTKRYRIGAVKNESFFTAPFVTVNTVEYRTSHIVDMHLKNHNRMLPPTGTNHATVATQKNDFEFPDAERVKTRYRLKSAPLTKHLNQ